MPCLGQSQQQLQILANIGEAGSRLKIRRQGVYQSFVTKVELKPNHKIEKSRLSIKSNIEANIEFLAEFLSLKVEFLIESGIKNLYKWV